MSLRLANTANNSENIYTGFGINRSFGKFRGATLTLDRQSGSLLIALIALYVGAVSGSIWKIIILLLHAMFTSPNPQDGVHNQRQAILRNTPLAYDAAFDLVWASIV